MELNPQDLDHMTPMQEKAFWNRFEWALDHDQGEAAKAHLAAGRAIYIMEDVYPGKTIKEYPDGRRQIVTFNMKTGEEMVEQEL